MKKKKKKKQEKKMGAQVVEPAAEQAPTEEEPPRCDTVRWETLPSCMVESVIGVTRDLSQRFRTTTATEPLANTFLKNNRLTYLLILFLLLFFVYRIFRR